MTRQEIGILLLLLVLCAIVAAASPQFLSVVNLQNVGRLVGTYGIFSIGVGIVIITGGIDLSVGSVLALAGVAAALLVKAGVPVPVAMLGGMLVGAACGWVNGICVTRMGLPPFIATLGMMLVARGVALQITGARPVSGLGDAFGELGNGALFKVSHIGAYGFPDTVFPGIPYPVVIMVVLFVAVSVLLSRTSLGRHIYAVGSNAEAARLSGVNVQGVKLFTYVLSGVLAGATGCVLMSRLVTAQPNEGVMYELDAIASAVIGGTSLMGGVGTISGTAIGAFVIGVLRNGLNMNGVSSFIQQIIIGVVILGTVWIDQLRNRKS
jgi:ribose transport system permease protein